MWGVEGTLLPVDWWDSLFFLHVILLGYLVVGCPVFGDPPYGAYNSLCMYFMAAALSWQNSGGVGVTELKMLLRYIYCFYEFCHY